ncbi:hypothetical protein C2W62_15645 [Candidatus Entotheonella serta]|nr:hypothetical protein C2W62_15645 [Candidatus Entotheonella serta]
MQMATNGFRDPEASAWYHVRLALYELQAGHMQPATRRIAAILASQPDYAPALAAHGRFLLAQGHPQDAIAPLQRAMALNPLPESQWLLIEALHAAGRSREAQTVEQTLIERGADDDRRTLALYLATLAGPPVTAVRLAQAELKVREDVLTLDALAWALNAAGRYQEAPRGQYARHAGGHSGCALRGLKIITYPTHCEKGDYPQTLFPNPIGAQSVFGSGLG